MGDIVNLRRVKKQRVREAEAAAAAENRVRHGRTGARKAADRLEQARVQRTLDGKQREPTDTQP